MKRIEIALALLALASGEAGAQDVRPVVHVSYADLDLRTVAGVRALDRRLAWAIGAVCAGAHDAMQACLVEEAADVAAQRNRALAAESARRPSHEYCRQLL